ncbi:MAG: hypothetical protein HY597_02975 [Candidatus Omnitrophica bacterium]|nr:hypothetical protein [Candidatus Omnitrophota bacterium]
MQKTTLSTRQAEELLEHLPVATKIRLVRKFEQETWPERFRQLLARIDAKLRRNPGLRRELMKDVGPGRRAFYAARGRRR